MGVSDAVLWALPARAAWWLLAGLVCVGCGGSAVTPQEPLPAPAPSAPPTPSAAPSVEAPLEPPAPEPLPEGSIGAAGPLLLQRASGNHRWVALCQARTDSDGDGEVGFRVGPRGEINGDALASYLVRGAGEGLPLEEFIDADPSGRWLLFRRDGKLELFDDYSAKSVDLSALGADVRDDVSRDLPHRVLSFDAAGKLAYLRLGQHQSGMLPGQRKEELVVRDLESGQERVFDPGRGSVYRLRLDPTGNWLLLQVLIDDTNGNGRFDWPLPEQGQGVSKRCVPPRATYSVYPGRGDKLYTRSLYLGKLGPGRSPKLERRDGLVTPLGSRLVFRQAGARLYTRGYRLGRPHTDAVELDGCEAHVLYADAARNSLVVACEPSAEDIKKTHNYRHAVELVRLLGSGQLQRTPLGFDLAPIRSDTWGDTVTGPRLLDFYPGSETRLLDMQDGRVLPLKVGDIVVHTFEAHALVRRRNALWLYDAEAKEPWTDLHASVDEVAEELHHGRYSWVSPQWIDLEEGRVLGTQPRVLALSDDGRALVPVSPEGGDAELVSGPLMWVEAGHQVVPRGSDAEP
ncbi:MAG: hypothetical protein H6718_31485 [Polyangiaceae bacterium]|nr:hypothetical protein [Polyangiaceae bacterium]